MPVFGHVRNATCTTRLAVGFGTCEVNRLALDADGAGGVCIAAQYFEQFGLAVACNAGNAQNFACAHFKRNTFEPFDTFFVGQAEVFDLKNWLAGFGFFLVNLKQDLAAHHHLRQPLRAGLGRLHSRRHLAAPHHRDGVGGIHDFAQFMRDEDDCFALGPQVVEDAEEVIGLCRGQNTGGFVKDEDLSLTVECL